jgi:hypothetical protein
MGSPLDRERDFDFGLVGVAGDGEGDNVVV